MFFKDDENVQVVQFGTGDVLIVPGLLDLPNETVGAISFCPQEEREIGEEVRFDECKIDTMLGVKLRFVFTSKESISVLIDQLGKVIDLMTND